MLEIEEKIVKSAALGYVSGMLQEEPEIVVDLLYQEYPILDRNETKKIFEEEINEIIGRKP